MASGHQPMSAFEVGDQVRIDIPDRDDPDYDRYHGKDGKIVNITTDDAGLETGDERDNVLYEVAFQDHTADFRWRDLRPGE